MLGPLKDFDIDSYSSFLAEFSSQTENYGENIEKENERLLKAIIEERSAAYLYWTKQHNWALKISKLPLMQKRETGTIPILGVQNLRGGD
jgi:uncharacterized UBP type Zn finger protein